jgi:hypothetical protein
MVPQKALLFLVKVQTTAKVNEVSMLKQTHSPCHWAPLIVFDLHSA